jgi:two-component system chemotaxis response regulator CheB
MKLRVCLAVKSAFVSIALRKSLGEYPDAHILGEERSCHAAEKLLRDHSAAIAIVDLELLLEAEASTLLSVIGIRREPTILINARGAEIPAALAHRPLIRIISGRRPGEMDIGHIQTQLVPALRDSREARIQAVASSVLPSPPPQQTPPAQLKPASQTQHTPKTATAQAPKRPAPELIVIGVSTGGPTLLVKMLRSLARATIPTIIAQHMPASETAGFALRLSEEIGHPVIEVGAGPLADVPTISLVQGGKDFQILRNPSGKFRLKEASVPNNPFHPSIDHILLTAADADIAVHTVILTGMGQDGSTGALALARKGFPVIAQRPETCAVAGMPSAAINNGSAQLVQSPEQIVDSLNRWYASARAFDQEKAST